MSYDFMIYDFFTISPCKGTAFMPIKEYYVVKESQRMRGDAMISPVSRKMKMQFLFRFGAFFLGHSDKKQ